MFKGLLKFSLEKISSLYSFYKSEKVSIDRKSKNGMKANRAGYLIDLYLYTLLNEDISISKESLCNLEKFALKYVDVKLEEPGKLLYKQKNTERLKKLGYNTDITEASKLYRRFIEMPTLHQDNTLIMLITKFEEFIANYIGTLYLLFPDRYIENQSILFSDIKDKDIKQIQDRIVERRLDSVMRKSYTEWFKLFESHGINLDHCKCELEQLNEIYARRNIIVHNSKKVNESYLNMVKKTDAQLGDVLYADDDYIKKAFSTVTVIIFILMIESAKLINSNRSEYLESVFKDAFDELESQNYEVCLRVFDLLVKNKNLDMGHRTMSQVNYWIAKKQLYGLDSIKKDVEMFDVSAFDDSFCLAKNILLENYDSSNDILEYMLSKEEFSADAIEEWPLFYDYRKSKQYKAFRNDHKDIFDISVFDNKETTENTNQVPSVSSELKEIKKEIKKD